MNKAILTILITCFIVGGMGVVQASEPDVVTQEVYSGSQVNIPIVLMYDDFVSGGSLSVTVPTNLPISVNSYGEVVTATDAKIVNNSGGRVKIDSVSVDSGGSGWEIVSYDYDFESEKMNTHKIGLTLNGDKTTDEGVLEFNEVNWPILEDITSNELAITYDAKLPLLTDTVSNVTIGKVVFVISIVE